MIYSLIFVCGGLGCVCRFWLASCIGRHLHHAAFPWGTLGVNWLGAFLIGLLTTLGALRLNIPESARYALITGFLGGFTTFSAFSLETLLMLEKGEHLKAALYIALSVIGSLLLAYVGSLSLKIQL